MDIYNHVHRVCSHRIASTPRIPFPALTFPALNPSGITSTHLSNAFYSLTLLSNSPAIQSILYRVLDIYCHKELFTYPSKNAHIGRSKEKYREWNDKLRESILKFEKENEEQRRSGRHPLSSGDHVSPLSFPPSHLMHCSPQDELSSMILQRDELRREIVYSLKDVLVPEKKYEAQRKYDYLERVIGMMKEWYTLMGGSASSHVGVKESHPSPKSTPRRQSSYLSPTAVLSPPTSTIITSLNTIPLYEDAGGTIRPPTDSLDDPVEAPKAHVPPVRDVFHALELFIQNLSVWYVVSSQSPIHETNTALQRYETCLEEYHQSLCKFSRLQRSLVLDTHHTPSKSHRLTDVTLEEHDESIVIEDNADSFLVDPSALLENVTSSIHALHTALDQEEYYWTRDPIATLYPSLHADLQRILNYLTTLSLDIKKSLLEGFSSLKDKEKELQQVVLWIAGSPSYECGMETLEAEVRLLKRDIIRYQREYEDKIHDLEKQRRKSGGTSIKPKASEELKQVEHQLISSQVEYQYKSDQLNDLRKELCHLCSQTFPEIAMSNSSYFGVTNAPNSSSAAFTNGSSSSFPYPSIFSLPLLLSTHLNSSLHFLYQHAPLLSHGILQYHRSLEDYLNLTLVSSSERYLTYKAMHKNKEVFIKKYHITSSSGSQNNAVVSVSDQSLNQFEKLYLEAARLSEISYAQRHPEFGSRATDSFVDIQSLFISSPSSPTPSVYLVFPSYTNGNLVQFLGSYDAQLSLLSRISLMKGLCSALSYLHDQLHILHCNLKMENVLISSSYRCILSDYDISYLGDSNRYNGTVHTPSKGFLDYLPPENLPPNSLPMSMASDVYCYGICFLRVLNKPLCRNRDNGLHVVGYYDREDTKNGFKELVEKILSIDPNKRPSTSDILNSSFYRKWAEDNWVTIGEEPMIEEGGISRSDREEIENIKKCNSGKRPPGDSERESDDSSHSSVDITQPSGSVVNQVFLQRQRVCVNCGFETDLSQGVSCDCSTATTSSHFVCSVCLNQYIHSECSVDIVSRRWLKVFDKTTKEEFHVRRSAEHILPYFTTKKKCHVEGIDDVLEKNPWSDLHEFNHEFDVRNLYEDSHDMMKIICPAYHTVTDPKEKSRRCENLLSKADFLKFLTPQVLYEFERSSNELLEWKLTWEYSFRVTEERKQLLSNVIQLREKELPERDDEEKVPQYIKLIERYIENDIHCVRCPQCNYFVGNGKKINNHDTTDEGDKEITIEGKPISHDAMPLLPDNVPPPPRSNSSPLAAPSSSSSSNSSLAVVVCPSCSNYFCSICLTDCGPLPSKQKSRTRSFSAANISSTDVTKPITSIPQSYSGDEEVEILKRKKYFHCLTCPYNSFGRVWLSETEFGKLQEDRIESMTYDFIQTFPEEIREEYLEYLSVSCSGAIEAGQGSVDAKGDMEGKKGGEMKEVEI